MSGTAGKVILVNSTTGLACNGGSTPCSAAQLAQIVDLIGYGNANFFEGSGAAPTLSATTAALRAPAGQGCFDTDNNSADFLAGAPTPRNTSTTFAPCTGSTNPSGVGAASPSLLQSGDATLLTVTVTPGTNPGSTGLAVVADISAIGGSATQTFFDNGTNGDVTAGDNVFSFATTATAALGNYNLPATITDIELRSGSATIPLSIVTISAIHDVQGSGDTSPVTGNTVTVSGIVTGVRSNGFFVQLPEAEYDADPNTSEGVFVFTSSTPPPAAVLGNRVNVKGVVQEFVPSSSDRFSPPTTELGAPITVSLVSTGNPLPAAVVLTSATPNPGGGIGQLEKYEGMRVSVPSLVTISPTQGTITESSATSVSNGVFYGVISPNARPFREPGVETPEVLPPGSPCCVPFYDANPERIRVDTDAIGGTPLNVTTGVTVTGLIGPLDYTFRSYTIDQDPTVTPVATTADMTPTPVPAPALDEFTIATQNLERFFDTTDDPATQDAVLTTTAFNNRLNKASLVIRTMLRTPDILGVEEMENLTTLQALADKVNADAVTNGDPDPGYQAYLVEGNDIGGIDVGFLVKSTVASVTVAQAVIGGSCASNCDSKTATYINPANGQPEIIWDRPPLVLQGTILGANIPVTVIANHFRSLGGLTDADGRVRAKRNAGGEWLAQYVQWRQTTDPTDRITLVGDFNAYEFSDGYVDVMGAVKGTPAPADQVVLASTDYLTTNLTDLIDTVTASQKYSYSFDGNAQVLDHILVNPAMQTRFSHMNYARFDADFSEAYRNNANSPVRLSDHDGGVAFFTFQPQGTHVDVSAPANVTQGVPFSGTVTIRDASNNVLTTYTGTIHFTSSDTSASLPPDYTFTVVDGGTHTFTDGFTLSTVGQQSITGTDTLNSSINGTIQVVVDCPVVQVTATSNAPFCDGGTLNLDVTDVTGAAYAWTGPNNFSSTLRNPSIANATPADSGTYAVAVTKAGCTYNGSVDVTINAIPATPTISAGGSTTFCAGGSVTLTSSSATGNQWYFNGNPIQSATGQTYNANASGDYTVVVTISGCSSAASAATTVTVTPAPPTPTISAGGSTTFCAGGSVTLTSSSATGNQWYLNNNPIQNATNQTYDANAGGDYTVVVTASGCPSAPSTPTTVTVVANPPAPSLSVPRSVVVGATGVTASVTDHPGNTYTWTLTGGTITGGQGTSTITYNAGLPGTRMTLSVVETTGPGCASPAASAAQMVDFLDVPPSNGFHTFVTKIALAGITAGCGGGNFCPNDSVSRAQMAVFLLIGKHGSGYTPPQATGIFTDVPVGSFAANFIEELYTEGITGGCSSNPLKYCPNDVVTRAQMAVFLLIAEHGAGYTPPPATGIFGDVPPGSFARNFIEQLYNEGITGGCSSNPLLYCPTSSTSRGQMSVFLSVTFNLP